MEPNEKPPIKVDMLYQTAQKLAEERICKVCTEWDFMPPIGADSWAVALEKMADCMEWLSDELKAKL